MRLVTEISQTCTVFLCVSVLTRQRNSLVAPIPSIPIPSIQWAVIEPESASGSVGVWTESIECTPLQGRSVHTVRNCFSRWPPPMADDVVIRWGQTTQGEYILLSCRPPVGYPPYVAWAVAMRNVITFFVSISPSATTSAGVTASGWRFCGLMTELERKTKLLQCFDTDLYNA